ncbi:MAG: tetratricopeptide repeat protein [Planctomycetia bacterium]|nr:tetratricopeptide repeat protein [Planctomycetia bacterium]MCC7316099.1 tetratricopeptide repeat protein [Planctomycetota bacterium]OQZ03567.1 MAG: hypothetical protein B6D36_12725 [Planctomycetes bacterium UTPLA1]
MASGYTNVVRVWNDRIHAHVAFVALFTTYCILWTHWPALSARAFCFDDQEYFIDNPLVKSPGIDSAGRFFAEVFEPSTVRGYYQPLTMVSLMLDAAMGGSADNLRPFHRTSLALHVVNSLLLFTLLLQFFGRPWAAGLAAVAFGVHPLTVEPIAWVSERKTLLAAMFALASLVCYVRYTRARGRAAYAGVVVAYVLAILSKPTSLPLPVIMLLVDYWPLRRELRQSVVEKLPLFAFAALSAFVTYESQARTFGVELPGKHSWIEIPLRFCHNVAFYLFKIVRPMELSPHYPVPEPMGLSQPMVLAGVIVTALLLVGAALSLRRSRATACCLAIFVVGLLPTMQFVGFSGVIASDKFVYLPALGIVMLVAFGLTMGINALNAGKHRSAVVLIVPMMLVLALETSATRRQLGHWRDTRSLFAHMLTIAPKSDLVHLGLGIALAREGSPGEAEMHLRAAVQLEPLRADSHVALGNLLAAQNRHGEATAAYWEAIRIEPTRAATHLNLGVALAALGRTDEAIAAYQEALRLLPDYAAAHRNLAGLYSRVGKVNEAAEHADAAVRLSPGDVPALFDAAVILSKAGRTRDAEQVYREVLRIDAGHLPARNNHAVLLAMQDRHAEAEAILREGLSKGLEDAALHNNLGIVLDSLGRLDEAVQQFQAALRLSPDFADAHYNLAGVFATQNRVEDAMRHYHEVLRIAPDHDRARYRLEELENLRPNTRSQ